MRSLTVLGGGLAGCEAAWQAAERGLRVTLVEMRPATMTGAHATGWLAELVCSNSLGSSLPDRASGVLKDELRQMGSLLLRCAEATSVPAGGALAVDREAFARAVTEALAAHPRIELVVREATELPEGLCILATGPLTSPAMAEALRRFTGEDHLYFFDALAPVIAYDSIDRTLAFRASRRDKGELEEGDYLNCPMDREQYQAFVRALISAERIPLKPFEEAIRQGVKAGAHRFFEGCLPVEIIAERGPESLAFGPMRPVGLTDPRTGRWPYAVLQLRQDNRAGDLYNMVGFQTNLRQGEQERVFRMIPGLAQAEFVRYGQMHRNTFVNAPRLLRATLQTRTRDDLFLAGQLTGVEGYMGNIGTGLLAGWNASRLAAGLDPVAPPPATMLGALCHYIAEAEAATFQPMKANFGLLPPLDDPALRGKRPRAAAAAVRARDQMKQWLDQLQGDAGRA